FVFLVMIAAGSLFRCGIISKPVLKIKKEAVKEIKIIPKPVKVVHKKGNFIINDKTRILFEGGENTESVGEYFGEIIKKASGMNLLVTESSGTVQDSNFILLSSNLLKSKLGEEGYELKSTSKSVTVKANHAKGLFYAVQTIRQMLPPEIERRANENTDIVWTIPSAVIKDFPRFPFRGMHLDVCRHFFPVSFIKKYIDYLAMHKINTFHWHLTEDQGWRIEIKKYPKLTEVGSIRKETIIGKTEEYDGIEYGGYYTQEEIKEIVEYAGKRFITIIPEIEMPGHSVAALTAYPEYSCTGGPFELRTKWGVSKDIYCAGNDETFKFLEDILTEVIDLFPSKYIHIGGDEAPKDRWQECPKCQQRIKDEGLEDEHELQSYFIKRIEKFLNSKGRKLIGWDEILEGGLSPDATVMSWTGIEGGIDAATQGHDVIMVPYSHLYFDGYQADIEIEPLAIGYWAPIEKVYEFEPIPEVLTKKQKKHILGAEATLWTEYIATEEYAEYMLMPRISALAEIVWSPKRTRDWDDFAIRLQQQYERYMNLEANFRIPTPLVDNVI
ncbi:MAG: beta-N-acetylhexosaminidase, partial [Acidobacteriota bacterium]|nr:beta-N-acetylhexosaminidase [Acidobacteriota bacterium]